METIEQIKIDEGGYQAEVYLCSEGRLTWLYGRNIEDRPITESEWMKLKSAILCGLGQKHWADVLFHKDIQDLQNSFISYDVFNNDLPGEVTAIITNMAYNMGLTKFNIFAWPKFFKAIKEQDWKQAAIEGRDSKWFNQVGQRSVRLMNALENVK